MGLEKRKGASPLISDETTLARYSSTGDLVDGGERPLPRRQERQIPGKGLLLPALPVEPDADRHLVEGEGRPSLRGKQADLRPPEDLPAEGVAKTDGALPRTGG